MAGKFNLLTVMTLNAAGYKAGIDDAKKSTKSLVTGTSTAVNSIGSHFSKLGGMVGGVTAPLAGIRNAVMSGVGSFKAMLPAINGVKMALVSTGIGAIVIALGLAFGALTSYLSGTSEGSKKLREMLGFVSGAVTALMNRVKYLGGALFSLITGDIQGFKNSIKEAFAGGFFDEVTKAAKDSNDIEKQKSANILIQRNLKTQISDLEVKAARLNQQFRDPKLTDGERLKFLEQMLNVEDEIAATKKRAASAELKYRQDIVAMKGFSANGEDKDAVADAKVAINTIEIERINAGTRTQRMQAKLLASQEKAYEAEADAFRDMEADKVKAAKDAAEYTAQLEKAVWDALQEDLTSNTEDVPTPKAALDYGELIKANQEFIDSEKSDYAKRLEVQKNFYDKGVINKKEYEARIAAINVEAARAETQKKADIFAQYAQQANNLVNIISDFQTASMNKELAAAGNNEAAKDEIRKKYAEKQKQASIVQAIINGAVGVSQAFAQGGVLGFITGGLVLAGVAAQIAVINSQKFANGGIVGGSAFSGDTVHARVNSGEMILNKAQQGNLFAMANGGGSASGGEVTFKIRGTELVGVLNNQSKKTNNTR